MIFTLSLVLTFIVAIGKSTPVIDGQDVGEIRKFGYNYLVINPGTFPYMILVEIYYNDKFLTCGGVLIKPDVALTAGHCLKWYHGNKPKVWVHAGIVHLELEKEKGTRMPVEYFKIHEDLPTITDDGYYSSNDIAILWLRQPFQLSKFISIANLPNAEENNFENSKGTVIGWGINKVGEKTNMLQSSELTVMEQNKCQQYFKTKLTKSVFCAISDDKKAASSFGDSGGPFIIENKVVGLLAFGSTITKTSIGCGTKIICDPTRPAVYTKISKYINWINKQLKYVPSRHN